MHFEMRKLECDEQIVSEIKGVVKGDFCFRDRRNQGVGRWLKIEGPEWSPREVVYQAAVD
jgi:hypothetical protein